MATKRVKVLFNQYDQRLAQYEANGHVLNMTGMTYKAASKGQAERLPWSVIQPANDASAWFVLQAIHESQEDQ